MKTHRNQITPSPRDPALPSALGKGLSSKALVSQRRSQQAARELELSKGSAVTELAHLGDAIAPLFIMYMNNADKEREESRRREEERRQQDKKEREERRQLEKQEREVNRRREEERRRRDDMRFLAIMSSLRGNSQDGSGQPDLALMLSQDEAPKAAMSPDAVE